MAQNDVDYSGNPSGAELMDDYLAKEQQNVLTSNSGIQRPSYAVAGTKWLDTSVTPWVWKMYDGTSDVTLGTVNPSTHLFTPKTPLTTAGDILVQGADGNLSKLAAGVAGTVLTANGAEALPTYKVNPIGVLTYSASYTYKKNDVVVSTNEDDETALYKSLVDSNIGNDLSDDTKWEKLALGGGGDNIGDIKYSVLTEVPPGGAWCDGAEYTQAVFPDIYQMLVDGKLQKTDYATFNSSVSTNGCCGFFALDESAQKFKVPLLKDVYIKAGQTPSMFGAESLPNITGKATATYIWDNGFAEGAFEFENGIQIGGTGQGTTSKNLKIDASRSSSTYQNGAKVNPDHVVYRAYVVLYASAAESSSIIKDYEIYNTVPLLTPLFHPEEISDTNWLKSDGQWNPGNVYETVYNELNADYALGTDATDEIGGITISYRLTPKKRRICLADQDANVTALFEATGIAWYYVVDNSLSQFKLPRSKYAFVGNRDNVGGYVSESLPNITGKATATYIWVNGFAEGAFEFENGIPIDGTGDGRTSKNLKIDASRSSSTYQDGAPVQQRSIEAYLYFKVGNTTVNAQLVNVGNITNALGGKANKDLSNVSSNIAFVIESYKNGTSGYIVYSNGFCEQWGAISIPGNQIATVQLLKNFKDVNYCITNNKKLLNIDSTDGWGAGDFTVSSFRFANGHGSEITYNWHAVGFIS